MKMKKTDGSKVRLSSRILILIGILAVFLAGCESIFGPKAEEEEEEEDEDEEARIIVENQYGESLDIYMDGTFQFLITHTETKKIRDVSKDEHELEARIPGTGTVVDSTTIDVTSYTDFTWTIDDPPDINVTNYYGKTLKIYMDGNYQFDLVDKEDRWIIDVAMGERMLKALKASDNKEVASTTIDVTENKDYSWVIE
jgi:hypothetical protein